MQGTISIKHSAVGRLVRWEKWHDSKIPLFLVCVYYAALSRPSLTFQPLAGEIVALLVLFCISASFGHLANDFSDRAEDRVAGKRNPLAEISDAKATAIVWLFALAGLSYATIYYWSRPAVVVAVCLAYLVAGLYSFPPFRLKERGALGVFAATLAQRTLPALIVFIALGTLDATATALVCLSTFVGLRYILVHQIDDLSNDLHTGTATFGVAYGAPRLRILVARVVIPLELTSLAATLALMGANVPAVGVMSILYLIWTAASLRLRREQGKLPPLVGYRLLADLYFIYWPLTLAAALSMANIAFIPVLVLTALWQRKQLVREFRESVRLIRRSLSGPSAEPG